MAVNTVVQGTAANIIKKVMIKLYDEFKNNDDIKMLLQVHDELIFEVKDEVSEKYMEKIKEIMEGTYEGSLPPSCSCYPAVFATKADYDNAGGH